MRIQVVHSQWGYGEHDVLAGGEHDVELTDELAPLLAGAEAAGSVRVLDETEEERAELAKHVQSQADGEEALAAAVESGEWQDGNRRQYIVGARHLLDDETADLDDETRARFLAGVAETHDLLGEHEDAEATRGELAALVGGEAE